MPSSPVYEYPVGDQWIMLDAEDGYVLWTAIWKGTYYVVSTTCPF
jgi:hypothetical protein